MSKRRTTCAAVLLFNVACAERTNLAPVELSAASASAHTSSSASASGEAQFVKVETELVLDRSAYNVKLVVAGTAWTLITAEGLYRKDGNTPVVHLRAATSPPFAVMGREIVHWGDGQLFATPLSGERPRSLTTLEHMPRDVFASNEHFAWLDRSKLGDRILVMDKSGLKAGIRPIHRSEHEIVSGAMLQDWVYFVESMPEGKWRLGAISIRNIATPAKPGGAPTFGPVRSGRPPAFLLAETDLYYYDGPTRSVQRVTPDLQEEKTVARGIICSPLAVAQQIYCAHVGAVFSVDPTNDGESKSQVRVLDSPVRGPITAIAANLQQVVWIEDLDGKQLRVRTVRLP